MDSVCHLPHVKSDSESVALSMTIVVINNCDPSQGFVTSSVVLSEYMHYGLNVKNQARGRAEWIDLALTEDETSKGCISGQDG
jgi:hypothetical protein